MLNVNQKAVLSHLTEWYNSSNTFGVLHGAAGTGKTYLVEHFLTTLGKNCKPLLLAETNEAVNVLAKSVKNKYPTKTICSALGLVVSHTGGEKALVQKNQPNFEAFNLLIIDEASMLDSTKLELIRELGIKTLYIGHKSQLPPVDTKLTVTDKCISPVFEENFPTFNLTEAVRNKGELALFCDEAESLIYKRGILTSKYTVPVSMLHNALTQDYCIYDFKAGRTVCLAWTNKTVTMYNAKIRYALFGQAALQLDFVPTDRVILRSPTLMFANPVSAKVDSLETICSKANSSELLSTNTKGVVKFVSETTLLGIAVYELYIETNHFNIEHTQGIVYVAVNPDELDVLSKKLYVSALYERNLIAVDKKWKKYRDLHTVFSNCKHGYAITVHCAQGSTIPDVFVDEKDISSCTNPYLRKKLKYVAYSRASNALFRVT